jgi:hypothetical protein
MSGCAASSYTHSGLEVLSGHAVLIGNRAERLTGPEQLERVIQARTAPGEDRLTESSRRVDHDISRLIGRQVDEHRIAICAEVEPTQVRLNYFVEDSLPVTDNDQFGPSRRSAVRIGAPLTSGRPADWRR